MRVDTAPGENWDRVLDASWENGALIQAYYHDGPVPGEDPSDRILLLVRPEDTPVHWWLMNIEDATIIQVGLDLAMNRAKQDSVPARPLEREDGGEP